MTDLFVGLHRGPIDHEASSVINAVANGALNMGDAVRIIAEPSTELLPRVEAVDSQGEQVYGIVVGGDADGIFGDGATGAGTNDVNAAAFAAGDAVVIVTQGRTKARVTGTISLGAELTASGTGSLEAAAAADIVVGILLQGTGGADMAAVDIQRAGIF